MASATGAYVSIPGSMGSAYGGGHLSSDCTTTTASLDAEGAVVTANGMTFTVGVATPTAASTITGFNLDLNSNTL